MDQKPQTQKIQEALAKRLLKLQAESAVVQTVIAKTNQLEYENLAAIYLWWRAAVALPGYLEQAFKPTLVRRVFGESTGELSFRRLLYLMYGIYGLDKDSLDRKNRALLTLHTEHEKNHELYAKDGVAKLAGYIKSQGGINSLISNSNKSVAQSLSVKGGAGRAGGAGGASTSQSGIQQPVSSAATTGSVASARAVGAVGSFVPISQTTLGVGSSAPRATVGLRKSMAAINISDAVRYAALGDEAMNFFQNQGAPRTVVMNAPIPTNKDGYAIAILKRNVTGYELISATDTVQGMREVMVSAYRKRFDALPHTVRCLVELIKTQSLPANLLKLYDKLAELSAEKHDDNTKKKITRRVAYIASENALLLSPTFSDSGVVTVARLKNSLFEGDPVDCFMPTRCRKLIEHRLIASNDFNLFKPSEAQCIPRFQREGLASHMMRLENKANSADFLFVEFWGFEDTMGDGCAQLFFAESYIQRCPVQLRLSQTEFGKLSFDHINKWLASYGEHITRPANKLIQFGLDSNGFTFDFDLVNGSFRNHARSDFEQALNVQMPAKATFLAKDLCLALHSVGELQLVGDVSLAWSDDVLVLQYSTAVADYTVAVPTTHELIRKSSAFVQFCPMVPSGVSSVVSEHEGIDEQDLEMDMLFEQALIDANQPMTDTEIERIIGIEPDDYEEILEGFDRAIDGDDHD